MLTPAGSELLHVIQREIDERGEALCLSRLVDGCAISYRYAHLLLSENCSAWGLRQETIRRQSGGGRVKRITREAA